MQKNQVGTLLNKQQYQTLRLNVTKLDLSDVVTASATGEMTWNWEGEWTQNRGNTFID